MVLRRDIRQRYNIEGSGGSDLYVCLPFSLFLALPTSLIYLVFLFCFLPLNSLCTWCCVPCALTQESREIALEERSLTGGPSA